jgi:hypothetical protein
MNNLTNNVLRYISSLTTQAVALLRTSFANPPNHSSKNNAKVKPRAMKDLVRNRHASDGEIFHVLRHDNLA